MKGDFSRWDRVEGRNLNGVLHQQGRVLLDRDWNDQTHITNDWQDQAAREIIGARALAVPAHQPDAFRVDQAERAEAGVLLSVRPGRAWADGLSVHLASENGGPLENHATYLGPPVQDPPNDIEDGTCDAVVLEVWREALNGFQLPAELIEPALGGPDTTERVYTAMRFRLVRLDEGETCRDILDRLQDDDDAKGHLTVSLQPTITIEGDCPVVEGGGYVGFEHHLYRIEIAEVDDEAVLFKWSSFNGGLVGRGQWNDDRTKLTIRANDQAIRTSNLDDFYLEVVEYDTGQGYWRVSYGAHVTLNGDDLEVVTPPLFYVPVPVATDTVFFRLWNGILPVRDFPDTGPEPNTLRDGIRMAFDTDPGANYYPGDYWTFKVRAGEVGNPEPLIEAEPPHGVRYHRVPVAELCWHRREGQTLVAEIEDCRDRFRPLIDQKTCCTFAVGDGVRSQGDFNSLAAALQHLPPEGGEICLLPGLHEASVRIEGRRDVRIKGCGKKTWVIPHPDDRGAPIFHVIDSQGITLEHMNLVTLGGTAMLLQGTELSDLQDVEIAHNRILACEHAIRVERGYGLDVHHNYIRMLDREGGDVAVFVMAEETRIERNDVGVVHAGTTPPPDDVPDDLPDPADPCAQPELIYVDPRFLKAIVEFYWSFLFVLVPETPFTALGGIQIAGGSEQVKVLDNVIRGGAGNGITLGGTLPLTPTEDEESYTFEHDGRHFDVLVWISGTLHEGIIVEFTDGRGSGSVISGQPAAAHLSAGTYSVSLGGPYRIENVSIIDHVEFGITLAIHARETDASSALAFLDEIEIERNEISEMGLSGIGTYLIARDVVHVWDVAALKPSIARMGSPVRGLFIRQNHIHSCLQHPFDRPLQEEASRRGLGGISLGLSFPLVVSENRIEHNGETPENPACGIYVGSGAQFEISHNHISKNGGADAESTQQAYVRGSVVLAQGFGAGTIQSNIAAQPAGPALLIGPILGLLSVTDNQFLCGQSPVDGVVAIRGLRGDEESPLLPSILFNDNQVLLAAGQDQAVQIEGGDVAFNSNHVTASGLSVDSAVSVRIEGRTVRAISNRLVEDNGYASLVSMAGRMNTTTNNQGNHCIFVRTSHGGLRVDRNNLVLNSDLCEGDPFLFVDAARWTDFNGS